MGCMYQGQGRSLAEKFVTNCDSVKKIGVTAMDKMPNNHEIYSQWCPVLRVTEWC